MQQRLSLARALIHRPSLLLLDEPYTGLDPHAVGMLRRLLQSVGPESRTTVMTTHNLERGLELCDRLAILSGGHIVYRAEKASVTSAGLQEAYWQHVQGKTN